MGTVDRAAMYRLYHNRCNVEGRKEGRKERRKEGRKEGKKEKHNIITIMGGLEGCKRS